MAFTTRKSLLAKVREGDEVSWKDFYIAYKPLILLCGNDCSLTSDENDELVQSVMTEIFKHDILGKYDLDKVPDNVFFKYDPAKGRFRHFLRRIVRNQAIKIYHKRNHHLSIDDTDHAPEIPAQDVWDVLWDEEWKKHLLNMAMTELKGRVQAETFLAFEMYALQDRPVEEVASFLNLSVSSIYVAKSRCISILKDIVANLEER